MNQKHLIALFLLLFSSVSSAQMRYVTDDFEVMLRTGPSVQNKIIRPLRSGTRVQVLREDSGNGHSQVQTSDGEIGYMLRRFISNQPSARSQLSRLENQLTQLRSEPEALQAILANAQDENQDLIAQNIALTEQLNKQENKLNSIKELSGNVVEVAENNEKLKSEVQELLLQLDDIRIQYDDLKESRKTIENLIYAGLVIVGLFLGWILSISGRRNRGSWGA